MHSRDPNVQLLFHGTSLRAAKAIVDNGFQLPSAGGMFGAGIYFARTPLKSWQYSNGKGSAYLLVSSVALGASKPARRGKQIDPKIDLKRSWLMSMFGSSAYDSVVGVEQEEGGSVRVPEFTIYRPEQALPRFLIEVA